MNAFATEDRHEYHRRRIRRRARLVSWFAAPMVMLSVAVWLLYNMVVCAGSPGFWLWGFICGWSHLLPDASALLALAALGTLIVELADYSNTVLGPGAFDATSRVVRPLLAARSSYSTLEERHRKIVRAALEMCAWSAVLLLSVLIFYWFELAQPIGIVVIAGLIRLAYAGVRRLMSFYDGIGGSPPAPTKG